MGVGPRRSTERIEENVELAGRIAGQFGNVLMGSFDSLTQTLFDLLRSLSGGLKQRDGSGEGWGHRFEQIGDYSAACAPLEFSKTLDDRMRLGLEGDLYAWLEGGHVCSQVDTSSRSVSAGGHFVKRWTLARFACRPCHGTRLATRYAGEPITHPVTALFRSREAVYSPFREVDGIARQPAGIEGRPLDLDNPRAEVARHAADDSNTPPLDLTPNARHTA